MPEENLSISKQQKQEIANAIGNSGIADSILSNFDKLAKQGQLVFPKGYPVGNQLKLMYTYLSQNGLLNGVTAASVGEALAEAVIQALEIDKKQVYFIKFANRLQMFRSYYGDVKVTKETHLVKDIRSRVIYEGDVFEIDSDANGDEFVSVHKTKLENRDRAIVGAYAWADYYDGTKRYCIMTWKEIQTNWAKSKNSAGTVQKEFPQEMSKRTAIRRLVKMIFNTAPSDIGFETQALIGSYNRTTDEEYDNSNDAKVPFKKSTVNNTIEECDVPQIENSASNEGNDDTSEEIPSVF